TYRASARPGWVSARGREPAPQPQREYREHGDDARDSTFHRGAGVLYGSDTRRAERRADSEASRRARARLRSTQHRLAPRGALDTFPLPVPPRVRGPTCSTSYRCASACLTRAVDTRAVDRARQGVTGGQKPT